MLSDRDPSHTVNAIGDNAVEISAANDLSVRLEFDPATGLPSRQTYAGAGVTGAPAEITETFSDWRETAGLKMPHKVIQQENGAKTVEVTLTEFKINSGLSEAELSKRP
jgi:hypothetical protein